MATGNLNPGVSFKNKKPLITYDTDDRDLKKSNIDAFAETVREGLVFHFKGTSPQREHKHTTGVIPSSAVNLKGKAVPKANVDVDNGDVKVSYGIEVTDEDTFASNF